MQLIYEQSTPGRRGVKLPASDVPSASALPDSLLRTEKAGLAEVSELDLVRHFTNLSRRQASSFGCTLCQHTAGFFATCRKSRSG